MAALASRLCSPQWSIRIDDLDTARIAPGAEADILATLRRCGLSDQNTPIVRQSDRLDRYTRALHRLCDAELLFECRCSRRDVADHKVYPGHCRQHRVSTKQLDERLAMPHGSLYDSALRARLVGNVDFEDLIQGSHRVSLDTDIGDVVVHRRDGIMAYPLAAAVDDADAIDDVVRGADLLPATAAQIALMQRLDSTRPQYAHVPVLVDALGDKLGKQTRAPAIDDPLSELSMAWQALGQVPLASRSVMNFMTDATSLWSIERVPRSKTVNIPS